METLPAIDEMWDFSDPAATEARIREAVLSSTEESYRAEALTQIARAQGLQRDFDRAHETLDEVAALLPRVQERVEVRYLLERGRAWNSSGAKHKAKELFYSAFDAAKRAGDDYLTVDAAHMVAIVEEPKSALEWNLLGLQILEASSQERAKTWIGALSNNIAWTYHDTGDYATALSFFERGLEYRKSVGKEPGLRIARWAVARCKRSLGRIEEALEEQLQIVSDYFPDREGLDGYVAEEIAECQLALDRASEAKEWFALADVALSQDEWFVQSEGPRLARIRALAR